MPYEFYQAFWLLLGPALLAVFTEASESAAGSLTPTQLLGTVVLLSKGAGPRSDPASYRPITLLNAGANLLGKAMAVMPSRRFVALLCAACRTLVDSSASIQRVCLSFRVPPGQLLIVYSTAQPCWASLCREQSIAVLHVVWFCTCPLSSNAADVVCKRKAPPNQKKKTADGRKRRRYEIFNIKDRMTAS